MYALLHSWSDDQELCAGIDIASAVAGDADNVRQHGVLAVAALSSQTQETVLCLDEIDKVQERTENLLLDFLQTGRVPVRPGEHVQADMVRLTVFLTTNATRELGEPLLRRCRRIRMTPLTGEVMDVVIRAAFPEVPTHVITLARRACQRAAQAEGNSALSVQEIERFVGDAWFVAQSHEDLVLFLSQWALRTEQGQAKVGRTSLAQLWGEIVRARRAT